MTRREKIKALLEDPERNARLLANDKVITPLMYIGSAAGTISAQGAMLKLEVLVQEGEPRLEILPIALSRTQCRELSESLARLATQPHQASKASH